MKSKTIENKKTKIVIIICLSMILIFFISGFSLGKGFSKINIEGKGKIAEPILEIESGDTIELNNKEEKGIYEFKVKNYNENKITQTELNYNIEFLTSIPNEIKMEFYKNGEKIEINDNKTKDFTMKKNEKQEDKYKIQISCKDVTQIKELIQDIKIKIHSEQRKSTILNYN